MQKELDDLKMLVVEVGIDKRIGSPQAAVEDATGTLGLLTLGLAGNFLIGALFMA